MDHGEKVAGGFFIAAGDAAEVFDLVDEALDHMALFVEVLVVGDRLSAGGVGGDHGDAALLGHSGAEVVAVIGGIGDQEVGREIRDQRLGLAHLMLLARGQHDAQGVAERIDRDVQLRTQTTP